jgi:hypothetical protein
MWGVWPWCWPRWCCWRRDSGLNPRRRLPTVQGPVRSRPRARAAPDPKRELCGGAACQDRASRECHGGGGRSGAGRRPGGEGERRCDGREGPYDGRGGRSCEGEGRSGGDSLISAGGAGRNGPASPAPDLRRSGRSMRRLRRLRRRGRRRLHNRRHPWRRQARRRWRRPARRRLRVPASSRRTRALGPGESRRGRALLGRGGRSAGGGSNTKRRYVGRNVRNPSRREGRAQPCSRAYSSARDAVLPRG